MAKGDIARFNSVYEEYKRSPKVTRERIYRETMDEILGKDSKAQIIDGKLENLVPIKNLKD
jgi:membrane protease subunit HflK